MASEAWADAAQGESSRSVRWSRTCESMTNAPLTRVWSEVTDAVSEVELLHGAGFPRAIGEGTVGGRIRAYRKVRRAYGRRVPRGLAAIVKGISRVVPFTKRCHDDDLVAPGCVEPSW